jgi:hypothetical protein
VRVAVALGLAQADAVDDRGVVERVGDDRVVLAEQGLEQAAVGVEARAVEDRVLGAEEGRDRRLELLVAVLGAADEAHARQAVAAIVEGGAGRRGDLGVRRQPEVVVGAEVQHLATAGGDVGGLGRGDDPLVLPQASVPDLGQRLREHVLGVGVHGRGYTRARPPHALNARAGRRPTRARGSSAPDPRSSGRGCSAGPSPSRGARRCRRGRAATSRGCPGAADRAGR